MALVGTKKIRGVEVEIHAEQFGRWYIKAGDKNIGTGTTLEEAERQATSEIGKQKVKVEVRFFTTDGEEGVASGIHMGSRNVMAKIGGGKSEQLGNYGRKSYLKADTPEGVMEALADAQNAQRKAEETIRRIEGEYGLDLRQAVENAIEEKQGATAT